MTVAEREGNMSTGKSLSWEFEYSEIDKSQDLDSRGTKVTTVKCHGQIVAETRDRLDQIFNETAFLGRIVMDLSDVDYVDSSGLGGLMRLKLHAIKESGVSVKFEHMTPRVMQLLKLSNLADWFSS
jgi:anti-anti-sigma factor